MHNSVTLMTATWKLKHSRAQDYIGHHKSFTVGEQTENFIKWRILVSDKNIKKTISFGRLITFIEVAYSASFFFFSDSITCKSKQNSTLQNLLLSFLYKTLNCPKLLTMIPTKHYRNKESLLSLSATLLHTRGNQTTLHAQPTKAPLHHGTLLLFIATLRNE